MSEHTKTEANLWRAFQKESEARNRYTYYASTARKEGYEQIAAIFQKIADNEKEHAKLWFKELNELHGTRENLVTAAKNEYQEWSTDYLDMATDAENEGFKELAAAFRGVAAIEKEHEKQFARLLHNLDTRRVFEKCGIVSWECRNCGHIEPGEQAPEECPVCHHPRSYFEIRSENY